MKKLVFITNIPTPYRNFFFRRLQQAALQHDLVLDVWYMNRREPNRPWIIPDSQIDHTHRIYSERAVGRHLGMFWHICPKLVWDALTEPYWGVVLGGLASPAHLMSALAVRTRRRRVLWVESNLSSIGNSSASATGVKSWFTRLFDSFQVPGDRARAYVEHYRGKDRPANYLALPNVINEDVWLDPARHVAPGPAIMNELARGRSEGQKCIFIAARLEEVKGLAPLLSVLEPADRWQVVIAGDGSLRQSLMKLAADRGLDVVFTGQLDEQQAAWMMHRADLFCLPSRSDPSPLTVIEALASGRPLLLSGNVGNSADALEDSINGWSFRYDDAADLRRAIAQINQCDAAELETKGHASRMRFDQRFAADGVIGRYLAALKAALD